MVSQLLSNDKISFVACRNFTSNGKEYSVGDDFPQEDARNIEVFVRARYVIPVIDDIADKTHIRHWHRELRPKDEVLERLSRDRVQLLMPGEEIPGEPVDEPETTEAETPEESGAESFDPGDHTVTEVKDYLAAHPEDRDRVLAAEAAGRGRKGLLEE